jgi:predicted phosphodiesterase
MFYLIGDTHIPIDIDKLSKHNFPEQNNLTKNDYVIILGDFGIWHQDEEEKYWMNDLNNRNFTTLFIDGNHDNHFALNNMKIETWNGGNVHYIVDSVIHLMRGQVFTIDGLKFFTMGGAVSIDKHRRKEGISWWPEELPNYTEINTAMDNLDSHNWEIDYVLTHDAPELLYSKLGYTRKDNVLTKLFDLMTQDLKFKHWFCGHMHDDIFLGKYTLLYNKIIKL